MGSLAVLLAVALPLLGQDHRVRFPRYPISEECGSDACEEAAIVLTALVGMLQWETDLARFQDSPVVARVIETVHLQPEYGCLAAGRTPTSPAVGVVDRQLQLFAERRGKRISIVPCANVLAPDGAEAPLTRGPPVVVISPVDWMGLDDARLTVAVFLAPSWHGGNYFIFLHRGSTGWSVSRIGPGGAR